MSGKKGTLSWTILSAVVCISTLGWADSVTIKGLQYDGVENVEVEDGLLIIETGMQTHEKPLSSVDRIDLAAHKEFSAAEKLFSEKEYAKAIELYAVASKASRVPSWLGVLIGERKKLAEKRLKEASKKPEPKKVESKKTEPKKVEPDVVKVEPSKPQPKPLAPLATSIPVPPKSDPLSRIDIYFDAVAKAMAKPEDPRKKRSWSQLTSLQQTQAVQDYQKALAKAAKTANPYAGKTVCWAVRASDVRMAPEGKTGYLLIGRSPEGRSVNAFFPANQKDAIVAVRKGQTLAVQGTITVPSGTAKPGEDEADFFGTRVSGGGDENGVVLTSCSVVPMSGASLCSFDIPFKADTVLYVVDRSPSMKSRLHGVVEPIMASVYRLGGEQQYQIICSDASEPRTFGKKNFGRATLQPITTESRTAARSFLQKQKADTSDSLVPAMLKALSLAKGNTTLFLISDADWTDGRELVQQISSQNTASKVTIHTVLIGRPSQPAVTSMALLSKSNRGHFSYKPIRPRVERTVVVTPPVRGQIAMSPGPEKEPEAVVEEPTKEVAPKSPPKRISSKVKGKLRTLENALKQVTEMTRDTEDGTLSKRDSLVRAYNQAIAATKAFERAKYTPERASVCSWMYDTHTAGRRLTSLSYRYTNPSRYSHSCSIHCYIRRRGTPSISDEALYKEFCDELSRQQRFVSGLKPAKAKGKTRKGRIARPH